MNEFAVVTTPGGGEIIYVINNSNTAGGQMATDSRLLNRSLNNSGGKIGRGRPLHIRTDLLPTGLVEDVSCGGGGEDEVVEEEVVGGEVDYDGEQPGAEAEITFIEQAEEHKTEEETVTVYEVVGDEECGEEEWVEEDVLENGEVRDGNGGNVEEMVFEEEAVEEGEHVIYVTDDGHPVEGDVTFMQVLENTNLCSNLT